MPLTLILTLSSHRCLGDSFSAPTKPFIYTFPFYPVCATCPTHLIPSVRINRTILCNLLHSLITSSLSGPNIFLNALPNTLNLCHDQVSHPNNRYNCSFVHFKLYIFGQQVRTQTILDPMVASILRVQDARHCIMNAIPTCQCRPQISELFHIFLWEICSAFCSRDMNTKKI